MLASVAGYTDFGRSSAPRPLCEGGRPTYVRCSAALRGHDRPAKGGGGGPGGLRAHHKRDAGVRRLLPGRRRGRRVRFYKRLRAQGRRGAVDLPGRRVHSGAPSPLAPEPASSDGRRGRRIQGEVVVERHTERESSRSRCERAGVPEDPGFLLAPIHRSAWKRNSQKFATSSIAQATAKL